MTLFTGLSAFPLTPTSPAGEVDEEGLTRLIQHATAGGVASLGVLGSTGIYMFLDRTQRHRAVRTAVAAAGSTPVIAGVGALRTDEAQDLAEDAAREGASGLLLAPVSYTPLTDDEVFQHFAAVAAVTDLPICIYNNPTTTRFTFSPALVGRLAVLPTIKAIKLPLPVRPLAEDIADFRAHAPGLAIGYSGDWGIRPAFQAGADGFYSGAAGVFPAQAVALADAARKGDDEQAAALDTRFQPLWDIVKQAGGLRVFYACADILGLTDAQPPLPIQPLKGEMLEQVRKAIDGFSAQVPA